MSVGPRPTPYDPHTLKRYPDPVDTMSWDYAWLCSDNPAADQNHHLATGHHVFDDPTDPHRGSYDYGELHNQRPGTPSSTNSFPQTFPAALEAIGSYREEVAMLDIEGGRAAVGRYPGLLEARMNSGNTTERSVFEDDNSDVLSSTTSVNRRHNPGVRLLVLSTDRMLSWRLGNTEKRVGVGSTIYVDDTTACGNQMHPYVIKGVIGGTKSSISFTALPLTPSRLPPIFVFIPIKNARISAPVRLLHFFCRFALADDRDLLDISAN